MIFYFKYFDFFIANINAVFQTNLNLLGVLLPLGISFFTFQQIGYLVDTYRGETRDHTIVDYALFVVFFPQLVAGPIVTHEELITQFREERRRRFSQEYFADGIYCFAIGLAKKVLVADNLAMIADQGFGNPSGLTALDVVIVSLFYTFQLYFDFSGYCDMACGIAKMFHIDLPINFDSPYRTLSIKEFWNRWHITLGRFFTRYVYIPLGGNRKGTPRTMCNILFVFLLSGIWHGAGWTFILWGALHGILSVLYRICQGFWDKLPKLARWFMNFLVINFCWVIFRSDSISSFLVMMRQLVAGSWCRISVTLFEAFRNVEIDYVVAHVPVLNRLTQSYPWIWASLFLLLSMGLALFAKNCHRTSIRTKTSLSRGILCIVLIAWSVVSFSGVSRFLYFNF